MLKSKNTKYKTKKLKILLKIMLKKLINKRKKDI